MLNARTFRRRVLSLLSLTLATASFTQAHAAKTDAWPVFRGNANGTGVASGTISEQVELVWKKTIDGGSFDATAVIADGVIYLGDFDGNFYALDLANGDEIWTKKFETMFFSAAAVEGERIFVGDMDGRVMCLSAKDGEVLWTFETGGEINSAPGLFKDSILVGSQDGKLYRLRQEDGEEVWQYAADDMIQCSVTVAEEKVFLAGCDRVLHIVDCNTGEAASQTPIEAETRSTPAVDGDWAYFGTSRESVVGVNWKEGEVAWSFVPKRRFRFESSPALANGKVVIGGGDKLVHALDAKTGDELWSFPTRGRIDGSPVIVGERVVIGGGDGNIYALNLTDGSEVWSYAAGGTFTASPAVADGKLVIASTDGVVYCFGEK